MTERHMSWSSWVRLLLLSVLWGATFVLAGLALRALPPATLALLRVSVAALALVLALRLLGHGWPSRHWPWGAFLVMGLLNNALPFSLIFWGQTEIAAGMAGVVLVVGPDALRGLDRALVAQLAVLAAALSYAAAGLFGRRFTGQPPLRTAAGPLTASTVLLVAPVLLLERPWTLPVPGAATLLAVLALALLSTALAYVLYFQILAAAGPANLLLVTFLIPVSALLLAVPILGETVNARQLAGMALIGVGLAAIDGRPLPLLSARRPRAPRPARR